MTLLVLEVEVYHGPVGHIIESFKLALVMGIWMQFSSQMPSNCTKFIFSSPVLSLCHTCGVVQRPSVVVHRTSPLTTRNN